MPSGPRITLSEHVGLQPGRQTALMYSLGIKIQSRWRKLARQELSDVSADTRKKYENAVQVKSYTSQGVTVELRGKFPAMFEQGLGPGGVGTYGVYDMRKFLLDGRSTSAKWPKTGPNGKWRPIPMKKTRGQALESARQALSQHNTSQAVIDAKMKQIENRLDSMSGTVMSQRNGRPVVVRQGDVLGRGTVPVLRPSMRSTVSIPSDRSQSTTHGLSHAHATDPFAGMIKIQGAYGRNQGGGANVQTSGFLTFRVISYGGKPWYHPGIRPRRIARMVVNQIDDLLPNPMEPGR